MPNLKKNAKKSSGMLSVEANAMLAQEHAEEELKEQGLLPTSGEPKAPEVPDRIQDRICRITVRW